LVALFFSQFLQRYVRWVARTEQQDVFPLKFLAKNRSQNPASADRRSVGDERVGQVTEPDIVVRLSLPADEQRSESVVPAVGALDYPATRFALVATDERRFTATPDVRFDVAEVEPDPERSVVVPLVHAAFLRPVAAARCDRFDRVDGAQCHPQIGHVGGADREPDRDTACIRDKMSFAARFGSIGWARTRVIPPFGAFTMMASSELQIQPIRFFLS